MKLSNEILEKAEYWASSTAFDQETRAEVAKLIDEKDQKEILERFHSEMSFGTGGMRGIVGIGCARINEYTLRKATTALCLYLKKKLPNKDLKVAISFDSRKTSKGFSEVVSEVLVHHGVKVFLTKELRPTPLLSFMVRHFACDAGICITASHNPPNYNGYKVYWSDGSQVVIPHDQGIISEYQKITDYSLLKHGDFLQALVQGQVVYCDNALDKAYLKEVKALSYRQGFSRDQKIVYTPLHGAGVSIMSKVLQQEGFLNLSLVPEQEIPDGDFPTVKSPNPENHEALLLAKKHADSIGSDLVLATDPDADRLAFSFRLKNGRWFDPSGHKQAILLTHYILSSLNEQKKLPKNPYLVKTIVTTDMLSILAKHYGCGMGETLTGFKWIADVIAHKEKLGENFVCGCEESYGFMAKSFVRDKDGIGTALVVCEMFAYYQSIRLNLSEVLDQIYEEHGFYCEAAESVELPGTDGLEKINKLMSFFRSKDCLKVFNKELQSRTDYDKQEKVFYPDERVETYSTFPKSNVLSFRFKDNFRFVMRPSGTEAKVKLYFFHHASKPVNKSFAEHKSQVNANLENFRSQFMQKFHQL